MPIRDNDHILVTGATGFLGSHLMPVLSAAYPTAEITPVSSSDYDLTVPNSVQKAFKDLQPTIVVHLAAYSGGIEANRTFPADFFHINLMLMENIFHTSSEFKVKKLMYPIGGCGYPNTATSPIGEDQLWSGYPNTNSSGYSMAKKMGVVAGESYRTQHGLHSMIVIPGNMYGEYDNYHPEHSHVIPGLVRRFCEARREKLEHVTIWGSGSPTRDFVYAGDVAQILADLLDNDEETGPINISSGTTTTIRELAELIHELTGFDGELRWDADKPDGQMFKVFDVSKLENLGLRCETSLRNGLERTIRWFEENYDTPGAIRL